MLSLLNNIAKRVLVLPLFVLVSRSYAQSVTIVESFGVASASQVRAGLGFNIDPVHEWEFEAAKQLGSTYVRFDCGWPLTEKQNLDNTSAGFSLPPQCASGLALSRTYLQHPSINALYGPPFHVIAHAMLATTVPSGSYVLPLSSVRGKLDEAGLNTEIQLESHVQITKRHSYPGGLIISMDPVANQVTLASATSTTPAAGTKLIINQLLYPPVILKTSEDFMANPSIMAFGRYAHFLAESIQNVGLVGEVGLWNEPNWANDVWDNGALLFDHLPAQFARPTSTAVVIPLYVSSTASVRGVIYDSGYTEKTGFGSIYIPGNIARIPSISNAQKTVAVESTHPYGNSPEDHFWYPACLANLIANPRAGTLVYSECTPVGANASSNAKYAVLYSMMPEAQGGARHNVTETGLCRQCIAGITEEQVTRFIMRQFIGFQGLGVSPIMFYRLADRNKDNFSWINYQSHEPLPVFKAMQALMADVSTIAKTSTAVFNCSLPHVTTYIGYYPLATVAFIGDCANHKANAVRFFTWQRSYPSKQSDPWVRLPSPPAVPIAVALPKGMRVVSVKDTVTMASLPYAVSGTQLTYLVADNPVEISLRRRSIHGPLSH